MVPEFNAPSSFRVRKSTEPETADRSGRSESTDEALRAPAKAAEGSIDVVFALEDPGQSELLEGFRAAFGDDRCKVQPLGDGRVVLRLYPGGARGLL